MIQLDLRDFDSQVVMPWNTPISQPVQHCQMPHQALLSGFGPGRGSGRAPVIPRGHGHGSSTILEKPSKAVALVFPASSL